MHFVSHDHSTPNTKHHTIHLHSTLHNHTIIISGVVSIEGLLSMAIPNKKRVETSILCIIVATVTLTANFHIFRRSLVLVPINNRIIHQRSSSKSPSLPSSKIATITIPPNTMPGRSYEEYIKDDYKAFIFAIHPEHGMLLLHCTRKKKKPPHFQVPGGHVDAEDFEHASSTVKDHGTNILLQACKIGAARELFEETGIDVRSALARYAIWFHSSY